MRPLLTLLVVVSAGAAWYMNTFAVMLDPTMIRNVLRTDAHEARELLNLHMIAWVMLWSALPLALSGWCGSNICVHWRAIARRAAYVFAAFFIAVTRHP